MTSTQELKTCNNYYDELDYLTLLVKNPKFMDLTIIKPTYLHDKNGFMLKALLYDHTIHKELVYDNLKVIENFDFDYLFEIVNNDPFYINLENKFKELEKGIIDVYKIEQIQEFIKESKDFDSIYKEINELN